MDQSYLKKLIILKQIQQCPEQFIIEYFDELIMEIDLHFTEIDEECLKNKWIKSIDLLKANQNWLLEYVQFKKIAKFKSAIDDLESCQDEKQLQIIQFKIESTILHSTSLFFYKNYKGLNISFLVCILDEYIPKSNFKNFSYKHLDKDYLNVHYTQEHIDLCYESQELSAEDFCAAAISLEMKEKTSCIINEKDVETLDKNLFQNMPNIKDIDFSKNKIKEINAEFFKNLLNITSLDLSENIIQMLPTDYIDHLELLEDI
jgi:Leucine-rich repeat (LRR) protein